MIFGSMSMKFYAIFPIFIIICLTHTNGYTCKNGTDYVETLRCRLFTNYSSSISAKTSQNYPQGLDLGIFYADVDVSGILQLIGNARATWRDDQLTWKPNKDHIIEALDIRNQFDQIWKPDFILINNVFRENKTLLGSIDFTCTVLHNGTVTFRTKYISIQAKCPIKIENRPWFNHTCPLNFKTSSSNFIFTTHNEGNLTGSFLQNVNSTIESPWSVNKTRRVQPTDGNNTSTNDTILIEVDLRRNVSVYNSTKCISYPVSHEDALRCYLQTKFDLLSPPPELNPSLPPNMTDVLSVMAFMGITYVDYNIEDGILLLTGHFSVHWDDARVMAWDVNKFGWRASIKFEPNSVWKPSLTLNNHLFLEDSFNNETFVGNQLVIASWLGSFRFRTSMNLHTRCDMSSNSWPWSAHKCSLNFTTNTRAMDPKVFLQDEAVADQLSRVKSLWRITSHKTRLDFPNFNLEITFEMKSQSLRVVSCLTFISVSLITLLSFWIPPISSTKLASKISSLLLLALYLVMLMNSIPHFTTIAPHFMIGFVMLSLVVGISGCITAYIARLAGKSRLYHPSLIMDITRSNSELSKGENYDTNSILSEDITHTGDEYTIKESLSKKSRDEFLKIAILIERSSFAICLMIVIFLTISLMT
ncbi:uncharacterized protein LOC135842723 isoform X2 [Planococcus citri]|uniref:uncharacterized protein LOC135842723 isoform X2 n=1 Tax=Planococcus citri TaxID=170843 RepID=UPI0031F7DEAD